LNIEGKGGKEEVREGIWGRVFEGGSFFGLRGIGMVLDGEKEGKKRRRRRRT
jgi:hypothetical protein